MFVCLFLSAVVGTIRSKFGFSIASSTRGWVDSGSRAVDPPRSHAARRLRYRVVGIASLELGAVVSYFVTLLAFDSMGMSLNYQNSSTDTCLL